MSRDRTKGRRGVSRAFRPALEGARLEPRLVLTTTQLPLAQFLLTHPNIGYAFAFNNPKFVQGSKAHVFPFGSQFNTGVSDVQTARGGSSVVIAQPDGSRFRVSLVLADNQFDGGLTAETGSAGNGVVPTSSIQPVGTIRAYPMPGGKIGLIVDGATQYQQLEIDPLPFSQRKNYAHSFAYAEADRTHVLQVGSIQVNGGSLQAILGFHSADLSGPLSMGGTGTVDRIAFNNLLPGASISVGGTLNTLDIANNAALTAGPGIIVAGDLNLLNVGQNLVLANGASLTVNRFIGLTPQPPKGTSTGSNVLSLNQAQIGTGVSFLTQSVSAYIQGDVIIGPGSFLTIISGIASSSTTSTGQVTASPFVINGMLNVFSTAQIKIPNIDVGVNFIARNGIHIAT
jgi:hypothetical protein